MGASRRNPETPFLFSTFPQQKEVCNFLYLHPFGTIEKEFSQYKKEASHAGHGHPKNTALKISRKFAARLGYSGSNPCDNNGDSHGCGLELQRRELLLPKKFKPV